MGSRLARLLRHRWVDERSVRRALPAEALDRLEAQVAQSERHHSGEIRVCVEAGLPLSYLWRGAPARERAVALFGKLRVWDTEHNNGVLIYLLLADHEIELVVDRGLDRCVPAEHWATMVRELSRALRAGRFEEGLSQALAAVDALLVQHYPLAGDAPNANELTNTVHVIA
ncbi:TPM domain-containing protein [Ideonella sp.]|uniref:TPM domain-containing protein n=1 Tax=Ideonella sp. TaxID=1929293 RepID=UPI0035B345BA